MVVIDSRKAAVCYKLSINSYIAEHGYAMNTLVAFSGEIEDLESGPDKFTGSTMNLCRGGQDLRSAFAGMNTR
jgi:type I restriction enzyme R subunit